MKFRSRCVPLVAALAGAFASTVSATPPPNDNFANAQVLTGTSGSGSGTTVDATVEPGEPMHGGSAAVNSVWYVWTAAADGTFVISKHDPTNGPTVGGYVGDAVNTLTEVGGASGDFPAYPPNLNRYSFLATAGVTYHISFNIGGGGAAFSFSYAFYPYPPNDNFANAEQISGLSGAVTGTCQGATVETGEPNATYNTVWYAWTAPVSGPIVFEGNAIWYSHLYKGDRLDALAEMPRYRAYYHGFYATQGVRYYIQVLSSLETFQLTWSAGPANDNFANALVLTGPSGSLGATDKGATADATDPKIWARAVEESVWYSWSAPADAVFSFSLSARFGQLLGVYTGDGPEQLTLVGADRQSVSFRAKAGVTYRLIVGQDSAMVNSFNTGDVRLSWNQGDSPADLSLLNLSTRARIGSGEDVLIGGFILRGDQPKKVMLRAIGPSLQASGIAASDCLADPQLELHNSNGDLIFSNDDWLNSSQKQEIIDSTIAPKDDKESAIVASLQPGNYTGIVRGANASTGIGLIEIYDLQSDSPSRLLNVSTRGSVAQQSEALIGGFIIGGSVPMKVMLRGIGPSLANTNPPTLNPLSDPLMHVHDASGAMISASNNWRAENASGSEIDGSGLAPASDLEPALILTLEPAGYTTIVGSADGRQGVALVEIYNLN